LIDIDVKVNLKGKSEKKPCPLLYIAREIGAVGKSKVRLYREVGLGT
jgi:hypothetical protein